MLFDMGNICCSEKRNRRHRLALLLVGLDNAGKTVAAKGLAGEFIDSPLPTVGFSVVELKYSHYNIKIFDLGGGPNIRGIWYKYFVDVHGVIFVIDSCDTSRFQEVKYALEDILKHDKIKGKPLLVLANKQDMECALDEVDIIECLQIEELANKYKCPTLVQSCCANETNLHKPDTGIKEGYEWIINYIDKNYDQLNLRVQMDSLEQEIRHHEEIVTKIKKIQAERELMKQNQDPDAIQTYSEYISNQNGNAVQNLEFKDFYPDPEEHSSHNTTVQSSTDSSVTSPAIFYVRNSSIDQERPKSAREFVRHQLKMNNDIRRSQSAKTRRNKTAPVNLFEQREILPRSAKESHKITLVKPQRNLKSADGRIFTISGNKVGPGGDYYNMPKVHREVFSIEDSLTKSKLPPLKVRSKVQINHEGDNNVICVVDVE